MTLAERYRRRAAHYAKEALAAEPRVRHMYADLAKAWRDLAEREEQGCVSPEVRTFERR